MPKEASELVRLDAGEIELIKLYRRCNSSRQDVLHHIADQLSKQSAPEVTRTGNVVLLTGRSLR